MRIILGCLALGAAVTAALPSVAETATGTPQGSQQPNVVILNPSGQAATPAAAPAAASQTPPASSPTVPASPGTAPAPAPTATPTAVPPEPSEAQGQAAPAAAPQTATSPPASAPAATGDTSQPTAATANGTAATPAPEQPPAVAAPPPPPPEPTLLVDINLTSQRMSVSENGEVKYKWPVSSARSGYTTPTGTFQPTWMSKMWYSRQYDYAPMPHSVFFHGGTAIHGTGAVGMLGRPASHGCVRLAPKNAALLYKLVNKHGKAATRIVVHGKAKQLPVVAERGPDPWYGSGRRYYAYPSGYYGYGYRYGYRPGPRYYALDEPYYMPRPRAYYGKPRRKAQRYVPYGYGYGYGF